MSIEFVPVTPGYITDDGDGVGSPGSNTSGKSRRNDEDDDDDNGHDYEEDGDDNMDMYARTYGLTSPWSVGQWSWL